MRTSDPAAAQPQRSKLRRPDRRRMGLCRQVMAEATRTPTCRVVKRLCLLTSMFKARDSGDRREADKVMAEANRWLKRYSFDMRVMEARDQLRQMHPVDPEDMDQANGT
jgi:hypothetical protein